MARLRLARALAPFVAMACFTLSAMLATGCGAEHAPPAEGTGGDDNEGGSGNDIRLPPEPQTGDCTTGSVQECTVYYEVGGIQSCFVGVQLCVEGSWDDTCSDQQTVDELIAELGYDDPPPGDGGAGAAGD